MWDYEGSCELARPLLSGDVCLVLRARHLWPEGQERMGSKLAR